MVMNDFEVQIVEPGSIASQSLFDSERFVEYQIKKSKLKYCILQVLKKGDIVYEIAYRVQKNEAISPVRGTFSFGEIKANHLTQSEFNHIIKILIDFQRSKGIKKWSITLPPSYYYSDFPLSLLNAFVVNTFKVENVDLNFHIDLHDNKRRQFNKTKRKFLNRALQKGHIFERVSCHNRIKEIYNIINENREKNGHKLSLSYSDLLDAHLNLPNVYEFFGLYEQQKCIAAAVCVNLGMNAAYVFYWAERYDNRHSSPVVELAYWLIDYYRNKQCRVLDLGISSEYSLPNSGLIKFKQDLGGVMTEKMTVSIVL
jgi:hypothetical protein